eukprot:2318414-Rhodomonas_salina.2
MIPTHQNPIQGTRLSVQFVPAVRFLVFDFGVYQHNTRRNQIHGTSFLVQTVLSRQRLAFDVAAPQYTSPVPLRQYRTSRTIIHYGSQVAELTSEVADFVVVLLEIRAVALGHRGVLRVELSAFPVRCERRLPQYRASATASDSEGHLPGQSRVEGKEDTGHTSTSVLALEQLYCAGSAPTPTPELTQ